MEDATNLGRIDLSLRLPGQVLLFEFKVVDDAPQGEALAPIRARGYAGKYHGRAAAIHLVGVEFSWRARNIVGFDVETVAG